MPSLLVLPEDILVHILRHMTFVESRGCARVSAGFRRACEVRCLHSLEVDDTLRTLDAMRVTASRRAALIMTTRYVMHANGGGIPTYVCARCKGGVRYIGNCSRCRASSLSPSPLTPCVCAACAGSALFVWVVFCFFKA